MYKILLRLTLIASLVFNVFNVSAVYAGQVQVTGQGTTKESAIHNAMRLAIEKEVGIMVDSRTYTQNYQLINSAIYTKSSGYIESYEVIRTDIIDGLYEVEMIANVRSDELRTHLMDRLQKQALVETNMNDPRIAVVAIDDTGAEYAEVENEIINAMHNHGFSRLVDLNQLDSSLKMRIKSAANDSTLRQALSNQFHVDYLIFVNIKTYNANSRPTANLAARMMSVNTGEIIYSGSFIGNARMFTNNNISGAIQMASRRAAQAISTAALKQAAQVEQHITLLITKSTMDYYGRNIVILNERIKSIPGVNNVFVRSLSNGVAEVDVNFNGTTTEFAVELERNNIKVIELNSAYIKI